MESKTPRTKKGNRLLKALLVLVVLVVIGGGGAAYFWVAPTPPVFEQNLTLVAAEQQAAAEGKLVLAVSTANWCLMCQQYKRGALTTDAVEQWVAANAAPVYVNVSEDPEANARLGVKATPGALPVTTLLRDGKVIAQHVGVLNESELLAWLEENSSGSTADTPDDATVPS